jgi:hypothetical protein
MDKLNAISLFDFFSFLIPGVVLQVALYLCMQLAGQQWPVPLPVFNNIGGALLVAVVAFGGYIIGHILHYAADKIKWLGLSTIKSQVNSQQLFKNDSVPAQALNKVCSNLLSFSFIDEYGNADIKNTDRFFEISFRLLEHKGLLNTSRNVQVQFIMFCNLYLAFLTAFVFSVFIFSIHFANINKPVLLQYCIITAILLLLLCICCYLIARQRRRVFLYTVWWQFYTYYISNSATLNKF